MNDRMTVAAQTRWSKAEPPINLVVEIYHNWTIFEAYWDATVYAWCNPHTGEVITSFAYWRKKR